MSITARKSSMKGDPASSESNENRQDNRSNSFIKLNFFSVESVIISDEKSPVALLNVNENNNNTQKRSDRRQIKVSRS